MIHSLISTRQLNNGYINDVMIMNDVMMMYDVVYSVAGDTVYMFNQ